MSPLFLTWIMNFGGDMMIVSPDSVIEEYIELARKAINIYQ